MDEEGVRGGGEAGEGRQAVDDTEWATPAVGVSLWADSSRGSVLRHLCWTRGSVEPRPPLVFVCVAQRGHRSHAPLSS